MIQLNNVSIGYKNSPLLLDDVSINIPAGILTALIGRNGSGKSTLLRALSGLNSEYSGKILINGSDIREISIDKRARTLAIVTTHTPRISNLTAKEVVALGRTPYTDWIGRLSDTDCNIVEQAIEYMGMTAYSNRQISSLSDGECQRIMIARAIAQQTPIILLDEPTSFLDMPNRYELVAILNDLAHNQNKTILFSTHELDIAVSMTDRIALIADHTIYYQPSSEMRLSHELAKMLGNTPTARAILSRLQDL